MALHIRKRIHKMKCKSRFCGKSKVHALIYLALLHLPNSQAFAQQGVRLSLGTEVVRSTHSFSNIAAVQSDLIPSLVTQQGEVPVGFWHTNQQWRLASTMPAVPLQILFGTLGTVAGGYGLGLLGASMTAGGGDFSGYVGLVLGMLPGMVIGSTTGVRWYGKKRFPGRGNFWGTLWGSVGGLVLGISVAGFSDIVEDPGRRILPATVLFVMPAVGATLGYQLSATFDEPTPLTETLGNLPLDVWASPNLDGGFSFGFNKSF